MQKSCLFIILIISASTLYGISIDTFSGNWNGAELGASNSTVSLEVRADTFFCSEYDGQAGLLTYSYTMRTVLLNDSQAYQIVISATYPYFQPGDTARSKYALVTSDSLMISTYPPPPLGPRLFPTSFNPGFDTLPGSIIAYKRVFSLTRSQDGIELAGSKNMPSFNGIRACPNPFSSCVYLSYAGKRRSGIHWSIYDLKGQRVAASGDDVFIWNGRDPAGRRLCMGMYLARLQTGQFIISRRILLL